MHLFYLFNVGVYSVQLLLGAMPAVVFSGFYIRLFATSDIFGFGGGRKTPPSSPLSRLPIALFPYLALLAKIHDVIVVSRNLFGTYIRNNYLA